MVIKLNGENLSIHNDFEIDFILKSKKRGEYIKNNDVLNFSNDIQVQKKIGIIGGNSSGKTSTLQKFKIYMQLQNFASTWSHIITKAINDFKLTPIINKNNEIILNNNFINLALVNNSIQGIDSLLDNEKELLLSHIKRHFLSFFAYASFDSNKDKIFLELQFINENAIYYSQYWLYKNGILQVNLLNDKKEIIHKKELDFISLELLEENKKPIDLNGWRLEIIDPSFDANFIFAINPFFLFPGSPMFNATIIHSIFDYIKINNKKNHFLKWMKIADSSIIDMIMENNLKIFYFQVVNDINIDINSLSLGTKKWLVLYYHLFIITNQISKKYSKLILFDEIENSFHYRLVEVIFTIFDEKKMGQLLFTTHNPYIFSKFFRHDGIYLAESDSGSFEIKRLDEFKLKKDIVISSQYLKENIGMHPNAQNILDFLDEKE